jgi:hypothetical protein
MQEGKTYVINLTSTAFDSYLILESPGGQAVARDDDSGGNLNARIIYRAAEAGTYRVIVTALNARTGPFQLYAQEQGSRSP